MRAGNAKLLEELRSLKAENATLRGLDPENDKTPFKIIFEQSALGNKIRRGGTSLNYVQKN